MEQMTIIQVHANTRFPTEEVTLLPRILPWGPSLSNTGTRTCLGRTQKNCTIELGMRGPSREREREEERIQMKISIPPNSLTK